MYGGYGGQKKKNNFSKKLNFDYARQHAQTPGADAGGIFGSGSHNSMLIP